MTQLTDAEADAYPRCHAASSPRDTRLDHRTVFIPPLACLTERVSVEKGREEKFMIHGCPVCFCASLAKTVEKAMAPHSSTPAWKIPWTEEPGRLQSMGSLMVRHD